MRKDRTAFFFRDLLPTGEAIMLPIKTAFSTTFAFLLFWGSLPVVQAEVLKPEEATRLLGTARVSGGLVVHVGGENARTTAAFRPSERMLVQGLHRDESVVASLRKELADGKNYGPISVVHWEGARLPYGDNMVNLMVVESEEPVAASEIVRVLAPRGCVFLREATPLAKTELSRVPIEGYPGWTLLRKPVPEEIDQWTHYLHDAGNNAVANDTRIGPPHHMQWKSGPMWSRSHEFASSVQAMVSANGRMIGVIDEGIIGQPRGVPTFWTLLARDAFNGVMLWRLPCEQIHPHALAARGDRVYVTLNRRGPLSILDAATGEILHRCEETGNVNSLSLSGDFVIVDTQLPDEEGRKRPHIALCDAEQGKLIWKRPVQAVAENTMVVGEGRICYFNERELVCLNLEDGEPLWRTETKSRGRGYAVLYEGTVSLTGGSLRVYDLEDGKLLWKGKDASPHARTPPGLFGARGMLWRAWEEVGGRSFVWQHEEEVRKGYDPTTGEVLETITARRLVTAGHHIRCYPPKATERYLLLNKRGVEFFDLTGENHMRANWTRAACGFGMLPANGYLYTTPSQCFCYQGVLLTGMNALANQWQPRLDAPPVPRLKQGTAFGKTETTASAYPESDWPTYRHDVFRSGSTASALPAENLEVLWELPIARPQRSPQEATDRIEPGTVLLMSGSATIHGRGAKKDDRAIIAWRGAETWISWEAEFEKSGKQPAWILQANSGQGGSRFALSVGDETITGNIRHTDGWNAYRWVAVGEIDIPEPGIHPVSVKPLEQVEGRLGNVAAVAIGCEKPPAIVATSPRLREYIHGGLTPPVAAGETIFLAQPDAHRVVAVDARDRNIAWQFTASGRVDSPPTIYQGLCLFGSTDGHVYCLKADTGELVWRFRAAPEDRRICSMGQLESVWPVHGSVLVRDGKVYCTAGRSSYLDGGIHVYALDPHRGEILHENLLRSEEPDVTKYGGRPFDMDGAKSDILVAGREDIYLFQKRFNSDLTLQETPRITKLGDRMCGEHLMTTDGLLDTTWFNRTYWTHSDRWPGYYFTYRGPKSGQILVFDDLFTYALKVYTKRVGHSPEFRPGENYLLIADRNTTKPVLDVMEIGAEKGRGFSRTELPVWMEPVPIRAKGMVLAQDRLYLVGPPDLSPDQGAYESMIGKRGSLFRAVDSGDGKTLSELEMEQVPVFDGMIAAGGNLYITTMEGTLLCLGEKK